MDIANYSSDSRAVIKNAREIAASFRHPEIYIEHLLIATIRHEGTEVESIINQLGKNRNWVESTVEEFLKEQPSKSSARDSLTVSPPVQEVLQQASDEKARLYDALVEPHHIFIAIFDPKSKLSGYLRDKLDIVKEDIYRAIADSKSVAQIAGSVSAAGGVDEESKGEVAGTLRYCIDLTNQAAAGEFDPCVGREKEVQQVIQILLRRRKNSPVLVGGAGVGKTAIVEGFAQAVIEKRVPKALEDVKMMQVDMGALVAGAKYKGEFEERFKSLVGEVVKSAGKIILFIDEIHTISGTGGGGGMDAANLLKPPLARGQIRLIGATTEEEYTKHLEKDKALDRRFERVKVAPPNFDEAVRIVRGVIPKYESHHRIAYTEAAIIGSVKYAQRYLSERNLPDIALDIVDEAGSEFCVKEEFAKTAIPAIASQITEIEKLIAACDGKDPAKEPGPHEKLTAAYEEFSRQFERFKGFWAHRLPTETGVAS
ncbi:MAG: AAA family ATPase [Candidatus Zixiibacteriota bacterium]